MKLLETIQSSFGVIVASRLLRLDQRPHPTKNTLPLQLVISMAVDRIIVDIQGCPCHVDWQCTSIAPIILPSKNMAVAQEQRQLLIRLWLDKSPSR